MVNIRMNIMNTTQNREETKAKCYVCTAVPFSLGKVVYTQGIQLLLDSYVGVNLSIYLQRHQNGDWGLRDPHIFSPELCRTYRFEASYG